MLNIDTKLTLWGADSGKADWGTFFPEQEQAALLYYFNAARKSYEPLFGAKAPIDELLKTNDYSLTRTDLVEVFSSMGVAFYSVKFTPQYKVYTAYHSARESEPNSRSAYLAATVYIPHHLRVPNITDWMSQLSKRSKEVYLMPNGRYKAGKKPDIKDEFSSFSQVSCEQEPFTHTPFCSAANAHLAYLIYDTPEQLMSILSAPYRKEFTQYREVFLVNRQDVTVNGFNSGIGTELSWATLSKQQEIVPPKKPIPGANGGSRWGEYWSSGGDDDDEEYTLRSKGKWFRSVMSALTGIGVGVLIGYFIWGGGFGSLRSASVSIKRDSLQTTQDSILKKEVYTLNQKVLQLTRERDQARAALQEVQATTAESEEAASTSSTTARSDIASNGNGPREREGEGEGEGQKQDAKGKM